MNEENIEPVLSSVSRSEQLDTIVVQFVVEPRISDVAHPVQRQLGVSLLEEDGLDLETVLASFIVVESCTWELEAAKVVDESGRGEEIESTEGSFLPILHTVSPRLAEEGSNLQHRFPGDRRGSRGWRRQGVRRSCSRPQS